ncbi:MAG: NAD-dependent epimerase/dehydratase family protein [Spirochaetaceae bacterium]|nr:MAG: NAD-dependent epimerase/dehydratase family protein [Spirochaetaceae bacterium]
MKVLVTGGAGFIGSHVADTYLQAGHEVIIVDNLSTGSTRNIPKKAKFYLLDIGTQELDKVFALEKPEIVNHHAAQISVTVSTRDPMQDARINALGLLNLLGTSVRHSIKKFIFISTGGAIYGDTEVMPTPEEHPPQPISPYGIHKFLGEQYLRFYAAQYGLKYTVLRYANVYGPRQNPLGEAGVVSIFINTLLKGETPTVFAYPEEPEGMLRDYVYVEDVAKANLLAADRGTGELINIGTAITTTTGALYQAISSFFSNSPEPKHGEARPGDLRRSCLDIRKANKILAWKPSVDLKEGLSRTVNFFS